LTLATEFFIKAMGLGSADACYQLGLMSSSGRMTDIDYTKTEHYYIVVANWGHIVAQFKLGQFYEDGYIDGKGFLDALKWYTKAFLQTNNQAILHLDELDDDPNFIIRHYSKQFRKLRIYSSHQLGKFSEDDALDYEKTTGRSLQFYGLVHYHLGYMYICGLSAVVDYNRAWHHFDISHKVFNTRQALYLLISK
jgi:TPR repeat protein